MCCSIAGTNRAQGGVKTSRGPLPCRMPDHLPQATFLEVQDTRISRVHCAIRLQAQRGGGLLQPCLEDHSSNGTYVNGNLVGQVGALVRPARLIDGSSGMGPGLWLGRL